MWVRVYERRGIISLATDGRQSTDEVKTYLITGKAQGNLGGGCLRYELLSAQGMDGTATQGPKEKTKIGVETESNERVKSSQEEDVNQEEMRARAKV